MKNKKKLSLENLQVQSFVTSLDHGSANTLKGGATDVDLCTGGRHCAVNVPNTLAQNMGCSFQGACPVRATLDCSIHGIECQE